MWGTSCAAQSPAAATELLRQLLYKRKGLFWLTALEVCVQGQMAHYFGACEWWRELLAVVAGKQRDEMWQDSQPSFQPSSQ